MVLLLLPRVTQSTFDRQAYQKCNPQAGFALSEGQGRLFEKSPLHPAKTLSVTVRDDGDGIFDTAPTPKITVTYRHACSMRDNLTLRSFLLRLFVTDTVFIEQPSRIDIQLSCESIRLNIKLKNGAKFRRCSRPSITARRNNCAIFSRSGSGGSFQSSVSVRSSSHSKVSVLRLRYSFWSC